MYAKRSIAMTKKVKNGCSSHKVTLYRYERTYKAGDTIVIETDSKKFLDKAKKEYAKHRKTKKAKKKPS